MFIFSKLKEMRFAHYSAIIDSITFPHFIRSTTQRITKQKIAYLLLKKIQKKYVNGIARKYQMIMINAYPLD